MLPTLPYWSMVALERLLSFFNYYHRHHRRSPPPALADI